MTFADGRGSTRAFHALQLVRVDEGLRRARIQEGDTAELHGNGAAVHLNLVVKEETSIVTTAAQGIGLTRRAREGTDQSRRRTSQQGRRRRSPMVRLIGSRGIPTERRLSHGLQSLAQQILKRQKLVARCWRRVVAEEASHGLQSLAQQILAAPQWWLAC